MTKPTHLAVTFAEAERCHPDLMEPYSGLLAEASTSDERRNVMEAGLRETFRGRFPMADERWPKAAPVDGVAS